MDKVDEIRIRISDSIGSVSALLTVAELPRAIIALAHGAGAGMTHPFMSSFAQHLSTYNFSTLRFNFPYMENKKKRPDVPAVAKKTIGMVLQEANAMFPNIPAFAVGKSFGGRMSSQFLAEECPSYVKGIVFAGFPLHPPGKISTERAEHLKKIGVPMLFLQGTRDTLADMASIERVCGELPTATLVKFEGADHSFKAGKHVLVKELSEATAEWIDSVLKR